MVARLRLGDGGFVQYTNEDNLGAVSLVRDPAGRGSTCGVQGGGLGRAVVMQHLRGKVPRRAVWVKVHVAVTSKFDVVTAKDHTMHNFVDACACSAAAEPGQPTAVIAFYQAVLHDLAVLIAALSALGHFTVAARGGEGFVVVGFCTHSGGYWSFLVWSLGTACAFKPVHEREVRRSFV